MIFIEVKDYYNAGKRALIDVDKIDYIEMEPDDEGFYLVSGSSMNCHVSRADLKRILKYIETDE